MIRAAIIAMVVLQAVRGGDAPAIVDAGGRQVLLRGVNVNQLNDYYAARPELRTVEPLTEEDFARIAALGFNHVRLLMAWSALEPRRGELDRDYLEKVRRAVGWAKEHGLYVVLDMHQDAWGKFVATPPGDQCAPPLEPAIGWDGAPDWATITDGMTTCRLQQRELSPAVAQAFTNFWLDRDGIQSAFIETWTKVVREFAAEPAIAGWDPFNEPHPGWAPGITGPTLLGRFYGRWIEAVRNAERSVPGGFPHIVFFEPHVTWSGFGIDTVPPPSFTGDTNIVFAPHLYAESIALDGGALVSIEDGFRYAQRIAETYGTTFWSGEWGWFGDPAADAAEVDEYSRLEDAHRVGGAWWVWKQSCGDPHMFGHPSAPAAEISPALNRLRCPESAELGMPEEFTRVLSRAYPRFAPGRLTALASDPLRLAGRGGDGDCTLEVWLPGEARPVLEGENVRRLRLRRVPGGWLATGCASGDYELRLTGNAPCTRRRAGTGNGRATTAGRAKRRRASRACAR